MRRKWFGVHCESPACREKHSILRAVINPSQGVMLHDRWLCSPECLLRELERSLESQIDVAAALPARRVHRIPLGLVLYSLGLVTNEVLQDALRKQRQEGKGRIGDWLRDIGAVTEWQVTRALAIQWALPIYPLERQAGALELARQVPIRLLEAFHMVPVSNGAAHTVLHVAFARRVDYSALHAIETMLDCRTEPCLAQESQIERLLWRLQTESDETRTVTEGPIAPTTIARSVVDELRHLEAMEVRAVACSNNVWVRLRARDKSRDLLFHSN
jgi:hypothetical protein